VNHMCRIISVKEELFSLLSGCSLLVFRLAIEVIVIATCFLSYSSMFSTTSTTASGRYVSLSSDYEVSSAELSSPPRVNHLDVVGRLTPSMNLPEWSHLDVVGRLTPSKDGNQEFTTPDLTIRLKHPDLSTQT
jgi:hypothetical protein